MIKKQIIIPNEIETVVNAMKKQFAITNIIENNAITTIETESIRIFDNLSITSDLKSGMIIEINNINYVVDDVLHEVSGDKIIINKTGINGSFWNVAGNFKTGTRIEINEILQQESGNLDRFPLIWLLQPNTTKYENDVIDFASDIVLVFAHKSNATDRANKRLNENINKVIQPLIDLFKFWLQSSDFNYMFEFEGYEKGFDFTQNIFPFYGTSDKTKNVLNTYTDAIEVQMQLKFKKQFI